ncbi:MAG: hypothetical protein HOP13_06140 [Alphaproteobacteria bacterium]|nr:hypothetical protein [Alphaproteobacteria bacterium]
MPPTADQTIIDWTSANIADFGKAPLRLLHNMHTRPEFSESALARLLEGLGRDDYQLTTMDTASHDLRNWREGELGSLPGHDLLEAVKTGRIWILILGTDKLDPAYRELVHEIYAELRAHVPGFKTSREKMGILISSPNVNVYYHCDIPGQTLWQVRGKKRVFVYPNRAPFLPQATLERIALRETYEFMPYDPAFDADAMIFDLEPGQMLHWPLNCPHRIVNGNCLNVSFTTEHFTQSDRRTFFVNYANGVLRQRLGRQNLSRSIAGPTYWAKLGVAAAYKFTGQQKKRRKVVTVDFVVDPRSPGGVRPIPGYQVQR